MYVYSVWTCGPKPNLPTQPTQPNQPHNKFLKNRDYGRGSKNCVHESMIPDWMDLVVWGHEHECLIKPTPSLVGGFYVCQPGSSVATSLVEGEAVPKQVYIYIEMDQGFSLCVCVSGGGERERGRRQTHTACAPPPLTTPPPTHPNQPNQTRPNQTKPIPPPNQTNQVTN